MFEEVVREANKLQPELVEIRRHIHRNPELGFDEKQTAGLVVAKLSAMGLDVNEGIAGTGVCSVLQGRDRQRAVALRADMDALPILEQNDVPYKSATSGIMHACGHDAHVAILLGAAKILTKLRERLELSVKFIFQPCEEQPSGGAEPMIREGVLETPEVEAIFGLHVNPYLPAGFLGLKDGVVMAAADGFSIDICGRGGHGAAPHQTVDPVVTAAQVILALQSVVSRQVDPVEPVVVSVGTVHGGTSFNVIADKVCLTGTVRTLNPLVRQQMPERIRGIVQGICRAYGAEFNMDYQWGYPTLVNDNKMLEVVRFAGQSVVGKQRVISVDNPSMGAEDFACFAAKVPGAYFFLGAKPVSGEVFPWHSPRFDIDESALSAGAAVLAACVLRVQEVLGREKTL